MNASFSLKEIFPCLFAVFVDILGFSLAMPVLIELFNSNIFFPVTTLDSVRFSYLAIGLVLYPIFMFFGSAFMGDLSDIVGRKKVLTICMGGFVLGFLTMGLGAMIHSLFFLFLGRSLTGLTAASLSVTMAAISDLSTPNNKATHMSLVVLVQSIGIVLGPLIAGVLSTPKFLPFGNKALPFFTASF
jgi:MFS family permease